MNTDTTIDLKVKAPLISDLLTLVGITNNRNRERRKDYCSRPAWINSSMNSPGINRKNFGAIRETLEELKRTGNFECVFPTENSV